MQPKTLTRGVVKLAALALASAPAPALACPVCYGMLEGPLADGTNKAILTLLGITGCVLAGFATFMIYLVRHARAVAEASVESEATREQGAAGHIMEGTA